MIVLRLLAVLIATALLTGCMIDDLKTDVKAAKLDTQALKSYMRGFPEPDECRPPGEDDSSKTCYYELLITDDTQSGQSVYSGKINPDVFPKMAKECVKSRNSLRPKYQNLEYPCPGDSDDPNYTYPDQDLVFTFYVDGVRPLNITAGNRYPFYSVPGTKHLKKADAFLQP